MAHLLCHNASGGFQFFAQAQLTTATKGAYGWNQAIKSEADAFKVFAVDDAKAKPCVKLVLVRCYRM